MVASELKAEGLPGLEQLIAELRPKLHRYCARMTGSVFDGEDVLQETLAKAVQALSNGELPRNGEAWLFRVAHNTAIDFLRRRRRHAEIFSSEDSDMAPDETPSAEDRGLAVAGLRTFMLLPPAQRSSIILMDVLGYSLDEIADMLHLSLPGLKATLHRGRERLRVLAQTDDDHPAPALGAAERRLLALYVDRFNARDFEAIREMLADEVRLDMVNKARLVGAAEVAAKYLDNYAIRADWRFSLAIVDGQPALLVRDPANPRGAISYFVQISYSQGRIIGIRDFRYARYVTEGAEIRSLA